MKNAFFAAFIFFAFVYAWKLWQTTSPAPSTATQAASSVAMGKNLSSSAVLRIDPKASSGIMPRTDLPVKPVSPDMQQYRDKKDFAALYARVKAGAQSPEAQYLQAELLERCAKRATQPNDPPARSREERREKFIANLTGTAEQKAMRSAAYDKINADHCGELAKIDRDDSTIERLRNEAAKAGDARARAWQLSADIQKVSEAMDEAVRTGKRPANGGASGNIITDAQWTQLRELLATGDIGVLNELRPVLASSLTDGTFRMGPDEPPVEQRALWQALGLLACDLGAPCGADSNAVLAECAHSNRCGSANFYDHTYFYDASPYTAQIMERYRQTLADMIRRGDASALQLVRGGQNNRGVSIFRGR